MKHSAFAFILLMGVVSMFSDMTHEGAAGILGAYLSLAGASAASIGFITGLGGLIGYSLRLITGILADRTKHYWTITILGYVVDCLAIPALALVSRDGWIWACALIVVQRIGKAVKKPAKDTILSFAATQYGVGKSFAIQEFLDQLGAFLGPLILFAVLAARKGADPFAAYSFCFALLGIPAIATVLLLLFAKHKFPNPEEFEPESKKTGPSIGRNHAFLLYLTGISVYAVGFIGFPMISMHALKTDLISPETMPLLYAWAMAVDAAAALLFGWLYDRSGVAALVLSATFSAPFAIFAFTMNSPALLWTGAALWGIGMGAQESILKAAVTNLVSKEKRSTGYGVFQTAFGVAFFCGSVLTGYLYDHSISTMIAVSVVCQIAAVPFFRFSASAAKRNNLP